MNYNKNIMIYLEMDLLAFSEEQQNDPVFLINESVKFLMSFCGYDITYDQVRYFFEKPMM